MPQEIDHVIALTMGNRAFDPILGWLQEPGYDMEGLTGGEWNPIDPGEPPGPNNKIVVTHDAQDVTPHDPGHGFHDVNVQLFSNPGGPPPPAGIDENKGFVFSYAQQDDVTRTTAPAIMDCFDPANLPVLTTLAKEFAVCKRWFSSVPGPTWPNRFFARSEEHTSELQSHVNLVCRLLLEKKNYNHRMYLFLKNKLYLAHHFLNIA